MKEERSIGEESEVEIRKKLIGEKEIKKEMKGDKEEYIERVIKEMMKEIEEKGMEDEVEGF